MAQWCNLRFNSIIPQRILLSLIVILQKGRYSIVSKSTGFEDTLGKVILALSLISYVILGKSLNHFGARFLHLWNGDSNYWSHKTIANNLYPTNCVNTVFKLCSLDCWVIFSHWKREKFLTSPTTISSPIKDSTLNILSLILQIELPKRVKEKKIPWFKRSENHYNLNSNHLMLILSSPQADTHLLNSITIWWHSVNLVLLCISQKEKSLKQNLISTLGKKWLRIINLGLILKL